MLLSSEDTRQNKILQYPSISLKSFLNLYRRIDRYSYLILTKMIKEINQVKDMNQQALCFTALAILFRSNHTCRRKLVLIVKAIQVPVKHKNVFTMRKDVAV